jgi:hypothetical protein
MKEFDAFIKSIELRAKKSGIENADGVNAFKVGFLSMFIKMEMHKNENLQKALVSYTKMNDVASSRLS